MGVLLGSRVGLGHEISFADGRNHTFRLRGMEINRQDVSESRMKYLYCPRCKQLRVKPWYAIRDRCLGCIGDAVVIRVPNSWMTYTTYMLYVVVPALVVLYVTSDIAVWIYAAIVLLGAMMILQYKDMRRGERYARSKIRVTTSDSEAFRKRGRN